MSKVTNIILTKEIGMQDLGVYVKLDFARQVTISIRLISRSSLTKEEMLMTRLLIRFASVVATKIGMSSQGLMIVSLERPTGETGKVNSLNKRTTLFVDPRQEWREDKEMATILP